MEKPKQVGIAALEAARNSRELSQKPSSERQSLERRQKQNQATCLDLATKLLGSRRLGSAADPEVYIAAITRVLSGYPIDIAQRVIDPLDGPLATLKWLPEPAEVRAACEELYGPVLRRLEYDQRSRQQLAERDALERDEASRPTAEEVRSKYGDHCGLDPTPDPALAPPDQKKTIERAVLISQRAIEREYAASGCAPMMAGDHIISPSLLKSLGKWPPAGPAGKP